MLSLFEIKYGPLYDIISFISTKDIIINILKINKLFNNTSYKVLLHRDNVIDLLINHESIMCIIKLLKMDTEHSMIYDYNRVLRYASYNGHTEIVKLLLEDSRVDPSDMYNYAMRWASNNGHNEIVKLLLEDSRVDPSADDYNRAIRWASENGHIEIVKLLLEDSRVDHWTMIIGQYGQHRKIAILK
jgi:ankyrin repeat protein